MKSTFSTVISFQSFHLFRFGRFVLLFRVLVHAEIINDITTDQTFWLNICPLTKLILLESAQKLRKNGDKMQGVHVDFEVFFFTQEAIGLRNEKMHSVTENVIYCYK